MITGHTIYLVLALIFNDGSLQMQAVQAFGSGDQVCMKFIAFVHPKMEEAVRKGEYKDFNYTCIDPTLTITNSALK